MHHFRFLRITFLLLVSFIRIDADTKPNLTRTVVSLDGLSLALPIEWYPLKQEVLNCLTNYSFFTQDQRVLQFSVSRKLGASAFKIAKANLLRSSPTPGWDLIVSRQIELPGYKDVQEEIHIDTKNKLTSFGYNLFYNMHIAMFTITYPGIVPTNYAPARSLVRGLVFK